MPNMSRPFSVMLVNWLSSISFEFSAGGRLYRGGAAVTDTCSVSVPIDREIFPRSRTSLAVTSIFD